jgi:hypothetical protein
MLDCFRAVFFEDQGEVYLPRRENNRIVPAKFVSGAEFRNDRDHFVLGGRYDLLRTEDKPEFDLVLYMPFGGKGRDRKTPKFLLNTVKSGYTEMSAVVINEKGNSVREVAAFEGIPNEDRANLLKELRTYIGALSYSA